MGLFDIFGKKPSSTSLTSAQIAQAQNFAAQVSAQTIAQLGTPQLTGGSSGSTLMIGSAGGTGGMTFPTTQWFTSTGIVAAGQPLTREEFAELEMLKTEYESRLKAAKITEFKKIPTDLRQFVINFYTWNEAVNHIDNTVETKGQRQIELENKDTMSKLFNSANTFTYGSAGYGGTTGLFNTLHANLVLPKGLTVEDLKNAHLEACLEEEMLEEA